MSTQRRDLGPGDVLVEIRCCGICHADISHARSEWRPEPYPLIPGHEFTDVVAAVGSGVSRHAMGDRVGVGCMVGSCGECAICRKGQEQYCLKGTTLTYGSVDRDGTLTQGGYSTHVVVDRTRTLRACCDACPTCGDVVETRLTPTLRGRKSAIREAGARRSHCSARAARAGPAPEKA